MTPERFADLADAYGGDVDAWPAGVRAAAREHLRTHIEAQALVREAARLDAALGAWTVEPPDLALAARIASVVARRHAHLRRLRLWFSSLGACATLAGGVAAGAACVALSRPVPDLAQEIGAPEIGAPEIGAPEIGAQEWGAGPSDELRVLGAPLNLDAPAAAGGHSG